MKYIVATIVVLSSLAVPALAQNNMGATPTCADYMAMDSDGQANAMHMMGEAMGADGKMASAGKMMTDDKMAADHKMDPSAMMAEAGKACKEYPDGTVSDAMKMMEGS